MLPDDKDIKFGKGKDLLAISYLTVDDIIKLANMTADKLDIPLSEIMFPVVHKIALSDNASEQNDEGTSL